MKNSVEPFYYDMDLNAISPKIRKFCKILFESEFDHISSKYYKNHLKLIENVLTIIMVQQIQFTMDYNQFFII